MSSSARRPVWLTRFFGRESETAELEKRLDGARLVTLVGPPGCGKSRMGGELAGRLESRFAGGVCVVELAPLADPARTASVVGAALGVGDQPDRSTVETLVEALADQELLLILDNCEHVVEAAAEVVRRLVEGCESLRILATSRVALGLPGEQVWNLAPLEPSVAVELFLDRARLVGSDFTADGTRDLASDICRRLDGLPLAIELAAAWTRVLSPMEIVGRLDQALPLPRSGIRPAIPRHETMESTVDWSYRLLVPGEQRLFETLSVFAGGFDMAAVEAVAAPDDDVLAGLTSLVDHSLVLTEPSSTEPMRYRMLEPVRHCAGAKLDARDDRDVIRQRHADHYLYVARRAEADLRGDQRGTTLRRLARDEGNLLVALEWARARRSEVGPRLAAALAQFWELRGRVNEGRAWLDEMLRLGSADPRLCGSALARAGRLAWRQRDYVQARDLLQRSLDIACELADPLVVARRRRSLALVSMTEGDTAAAIELCEQSIAACRAHQDDAGVVWGLIFLGLTRYVADEVAAGSRHIHDALAANGSVGSTAAIAAGQLYLSWAAGQSGDIAGQRAHLVAAFAAMRRLGGAVEPDWLYAGAALAVGEGRTHAALRLAGAAEAVSRRTGSHLNEPFMASADPLLHQARRQVGSRLAERLRAEGARTSLDHLMAEAEALPDDASDHPLTPRETEIAELVGRGLSNVEIARQLYISRRTVESHVEHIKRKLGVTTRHQVIAWILREAADP